MTTERRLTALEKRVGATDEEAAYRAMLAAIGVTSPEPRDWTDDQLEAALDWYRERDPESVPRVEAMTDAELEEALA